MQLHSVTYGNIDKNKKTILYGYAMRQKSKPLPADLRHWDVYQPAVYKDNQTATAQADKRALAILNFFKQSVEQA